MLKMILSNRQIAIAGRVLEGETKKAMSSAIVEIIEMPAKFKTQLSLQKLQYGSQWDKMHERPDRKITASDGYFHFINLPSGEYVLKAFSPNSASGYLPARKALKVFPAVEGKVSTTITEIVLSSIGIKGIITDADEPKKLILSFFNLD